VRPGFLGVFFALTLCAASAAISIDIDLAQQKAFLLQDGKIVYETPVSTGRPGRRTQTGVFQVLEKDENHLSSLYGKIMDASGGVVVRDADADTLVPPGDMFVPAPMRYFIRFDGPVGMHAGRLPGYPASHGCVRMPLAKAILFYNTVPIGAEVRVHGDPPERGGTRAAPKGVPRLVPAITPAPVVVQPRHRFFDWGSGPAAPATPPPRFYPR